MQADVIPTARELGTGVIAWAPLGNGALTDRWQTRDDMPLHDRRRRLTRFSEENFDQVRNAQGVSIPMSQYRTSDMWPGCDVLNQQSRQRFKRLPCTGP